MKEKTKIIISLSIIVYFLIGWMTVPWDGGEFFYIDKKFPLLGFMEFMLFRFTPLAIGVVLLTRTDKCKKVLILLYTTFSLFIIFKTIDNY